MSGYSTIGLWLPKRVSHPHLYRLSTYCLCIGLFGNGAPGPTRTAISTIKSRACCFDTTEALEPRPGTEPESRLYQSRILPLN